MAVTAALVKELRELTGSGMMDCKKALVETDGDNLRNVIEQMLFDNRFIFVVTIHVGL